MRVRAAARGVARIDALAAGAEAYDLVRVAVVAMLHPRRSRRHPSNGEAFDALRLFAEQARDFLRGNMPLDHIAAEENGVAAAQRRRHALLVLHRRHVGRIDDHRLLPERALHLLEPFEAAAARSEEPTSDLQ